MTLEPGCPWCAGPMVAGAVECPSCALPLIGPDAARLWQVDQQLAALATERGALVARLRSQRPIGAAAPGPDRSGWSGQQLLLGAGVLLVLVAAAVFLAVAWTVLGVAGQTGILAVVTMGTGAVALALSRRGLRASAAAAAVLTVGLAVADAAAARALDLAGLGAFDESGYAAVAGALLAVAFTAVARRDIRIVPFAIAAVLAAAVVPAGALGAGTPNPFVVAAVTLVAAAGFAVIWTRLSGPTAATAGIVAGLYLAAFWEAALPACYDGALAGVAGGCGALAVIAAAAAVVTAERRAGWRPQLLLLAAVTGPPALVGLANHGGLAGLTALTATAAAAAAAATLARVEPWATVGIGGAQLTATLSWAFAANQAADRLPATPPPLLAVAFACAAASATVIAVRRPAVRTVAAGYAAAAAAAAAAVPALQVGTATVAGTLAAAAALIAAVAATRSGRGEEVTLLAVAGAALLAALAVSVDAPALVTAGVFAAVGLTALAYAALPDRGLAAVLGVVSCSAASWTLLHAAEVRVVEAYSLPLAALALIVAAVRLARQPDAPSWATIGPGAAAGLLPSAYVSLDDPGLTRPLLTLAVAVAVALGGLMVRWQAPLVTGTVAAALVAAGQLAPYAVGLPRWVSLGSAGLLLLAVGARYEQRRQDAQAASRWVRALR